MVGIIKVCEGSQAIHDTPVTNNSQAHDCKPHKPMMMNQVANMYEFNIG